MGSSVCEWVGGTARVNSMLAELIDLTDPSGKAAGRMAQAFRDIMARDVRDKALRGVDRYGRRLVPVRERKGRYKGASGPPLAPFGVRSRIVTHFVTTALKTGDGFEIRAGWKDIKSDDGVDFFPFHIEGAGRNPVRNPAGITPAGFAQLRKKAGEIYKRRAG